MLPQTLIARAYIARGLRMWFGTRALVTGILLLGASDLRLSLPAMIQVVTLSIALCFVDTHRLRERALLGNLGIRPLTLATLFALPALLGELAIRAVIRQ